MAKNILHMLSPLRHMSPFDVNMALDAGFDAVVPYIDVKLEEVMPLVQDAMFSRSPRDAVHTGVFIGGKDAVLALDMLEQLRKTLLKPFEISAFADPAGSFTTAAAMVACVEKILKHKKGKTLAGTNIVIFGATGPVGYTSGVIARLEGAEVTLTARETEQVQAKADEIKKRFGLTVHALEANIARRGFRGAGRQGSRAVRGGGGRASPLEGSMLAAAKSLLVSADVNAVPPAGIEGLDLHATRCRTDRWQSRDRAARHRRREIQDGIWIVPTDGVVLQSDQPRFSRCLQSRA